MDSVKSESTAANDHQGLIDSKWGNIWKVEVKSSKIGIDKEEHTSGWIKKDKNKLVNLT